MSITCSKFDFQPWKFTVTSSNTYITQNFLITTHQKFSKKSDFESNHSFALPAIQNTAAVNKPTCNIQYTFPATFYKTVHAVTSAPKNIRYYAVLPQNSKLSNSH